MNTTQHRSTSPSTDTQAVLGKTRTAGSRAARRTSLATIGAAALVGLAMAGPASARPDDGEKAPQRTNLVVSEPRTPQPKPVTRTIRIDDNALEALQIGLGALGGLALAGAAAGTVSVRRHHHHAV
jgi:hypothetical protein